MFRTETIANHGYNTRSNINRRSHLAELIKSRDWQGVSQHARSHPYDVLIQDCYGLNPIHIALQSFNSTWNTEIMSASIFSTIEYSTLQNDRAASSDKIPISTSIPVSTMSELLASPFIAQCLIHQPPPLINTTLNLSETAESSSLTEAKATPLHLACRNTNTPDSIILAISRANPHALNLQDDDGDTPLHLALRYCVSEDVIQTLIDLAYHQTPHDTIGLDGDEGVAFAKSDDEDGDLPLHVATSHDASINTIQLLVDAYPQAMFAMNHMLQTPLMIACVCGRYDVVQDVILQSEVVIGCVKVLLEMGGNEFGGTCRPVYCLWEKFVASRDENRNDIEALETIAHLLTAITSSGSIDCGRMKGAIENVDSLVDTIIFSFDQSYQLLLAAINLGERIVPPEFVSFLIQNHPGIVCKIDHSTRRLPLHIAVMRPAHQSMLNYHGVGFSQSMPRTGFARSRYDNPSTPKDTDNASSISSDPISKHSHPILKVILDSNPMAAYKHDRLGCLPLHLAIKSGMTWKDGTRDIFMTAPGCIRTRDPTTGLYPFMLAACVESESVPDNVDSNIEELVDNDMKSLDRVFSLLKCSPDLVAFSCRENECSLDKVGHSKYFLDKKRRAKTDRENRRVLRSSKHLTRSRKRLKFSN